MVARRDEEGITVATSNTPVVTWGQVTERAERIVIVATGPSVSFVPLTLFEALYAMGVYILGVNGAGMWLPKMNGWFTLDPSPRNRQITSLRKQGVTYYVAVPDDYGQPNARLESHRSSRLQHVVYLRRVEGSGYLKQRLTLSEDPYSVHTGNSAWGALGIAYLMKPHKIVLLGVDCNNNGYAYQRRLRPKHSFDHLPALFASACPQLERSKITILNGSMESRLTCFEKAKPVKALEWILQK